MKNKQEKNQKVKVKKQYDKGRIFVKVMAGILCLMMVVAAFASLIFQLV